MISMVLLETIYKLIIQGKCTGWVNGANSNLQDKDM